MDLQVTTLFFEAISYVWGDAMQKLHLTCGGHDLVITRSLHAELHRLRHPDRSRLIWADAISINQADTEERGQQVSLMRTIYQRAAGVLVWLGPDTDGDAHAAFSLICNFVNAKALSPSPASFTITSPSLTPTPTHSPPPLPPLPARGNSRRNRARQLP
jgi:hypothetical protein